MHFADVDSPSVIGFNAPRLLIPGWMFERLTEPELQQVVLHECEHLRRGDDWLNLLQKTALALFPLNPALLWVDRRLGLEREMACDAGVVARMAAPIAYADCLTRLAEHRIIRRRVALSLSAWSRQSELGYRVRSLLQPIRRMSPVYAGTATVLLNLALVATSVEMARAPRILSFDGAVSSQLPSTASSELTPRQVEPSMKPASTSTPSSYLADYSGTSGQKPRLLEAALAVPRPASKLSGVAPAATEHKRPQPSLARAHASPFTQAGSVVPADAEVPAQVLSPRSRHSANRPVYALTIDFLPSYAAVPFGNGWLLVQL